jgi:hypothetical protein
MELIASYHIADQELSVILPKAFILLLMEALICRLPGEVGRLYQYMHNRLHLSELAIILIFLTFPILLGSCPPPLHTPPPSLIEAKHEKA